mmetsp:Transcript_6962/g.5218  ORF Transcript_6962/g.5218 Transcript_6962/m.5218 type:complete len:112 (+) Transcript_6962:890-1225(+)
MLEHFTNDETGEVYERVLPNYFNEFLKEPGHCRDDNEDLSEMKFIQHSLKSRFQLLPRSCYGYIYQSKEFLPNYQYQTGIYLVNTFNFFQWRTLDLVQKVHSATVDSVPLS